MRFVGMGRRKGWFSAVKKALISEHENKKSRKPKKKWFAKHQRRDPSFVSGEIESVSKNLHTTKEPDMSTPWTSPWCLLEEPYAPPVIEQMKMSGARSNDNDLAHSADRASERAAENTLVLTQTTKDVVRLANLARFGGMSVEEVAAIKIQTVFRGRRAKRALKALRGLVRLKSLVQGASIKRQTASTLHCMQTLYRLQSLIRARRIRMSEENHALQRQLQMKHEKEMEKIKLTIEDWNGSTKSKEKLEESLRYRQEAAMRRERALAYAHTTRQKMRNASKTHTPSLMDEINPHWGWSWLERWMASRPWETSIESENHRGTSVLSVAEISKAYYAHRERYPEHSNKPLPIPQRKSCISTRHTPSVSVSKAPSTTSTTLKSSNNKDSKSTGEVVSGKKRQSIASGGKKNLPSTQSARSSTTPKVTQKATKSRLQKSSSVEKSSVIKKQLPSSPSPTKSKVRRHSGPPSVDSSSVNNMKMKSCVENTTMAKVE